jgi:hypothetical protein
LVVRVAKAVSVSSADLRKNFVLEDFALTTGLARDATLAAVLFLFLADMKEKL